jgi:alkylated DNA repair dioxygenase AlkB
VPEALAPFLDWARRAITPTLNGLLVNWYDGRLRHYIGKHRDESGELIEGSPIVTISIGEERVFRIRRLGWKGSFIDFRVANGAVIVIPYETNLAWVHEVPHHARYRSRRISVTLRAFSTKD